MKGEVALGIHVIVGKSKHSWEPKTLNPKPAIWGTGLFKKLSDARKACHLKWLALCRFC